MSTTTTQRPARCARACALIAALGTLAPAAASLAEPGLDACHALSGIYVTTVTDTEGVFSSRGLVSLTSDGLFLMTDSVQAGLPGVYDPFGSA